MSGVEGFYNELGVQLPGGGAERAVRCFANPDGHRQGDRNPSCSVNAETGAWHCHGCGASGGAFDAAVELGRAPREAMDLLRAHGLVTEDGVRQHQVVQTQVSRKLRITEEAISRWATHLEDEESVRIIKSRGWSPDVLRRLGVGWNPEDGKYQNRHVLPARGADGALVGCGFAAFDREQRSAEKMLQAPGSRRPLFDVTSATPNEDFILVVEGEADALTCATMGLPALGVPGAGYGKNWSDGDTGRVRGKTVFCIPDADGNGRSCMEAITAKLVAAGIDAHHADVLWPDRNDDTEGAGSDISDWVRELYGGDCAKAAGELRDVLTWFLDVSQDTGAAVEEAEAGPLLTEIQEFISSYVTLPNDEALTACALWVLHTHAIEASEVTPYLAIGSAEKRSGKTQLFKVLQLLASNPQPTANISDAALYHVISNSPRPTLFFDEVDAVFGKAVRPGWNETLRGILNAGNQRGTPVIRMVGEGTKMEPKQFDVFSAKALAGIGELPDTISDRSIRIWMRRQRSGNKHRFYARDAAPPGLVLHDRCARWAAESISSLSDARPAFPQRLDDRAADAWEPLFAIADLAGNGWGDRARHAAIVLSEIREDSDAVSLGIRLLTEVRDVLIGRPDGWIWSADLCRELRDLPEAPWAGLGLDERMLANVLRPYEIKSKDIKRIGQVRKGFERSMFEDAWSRYCTPLQESLPPLPLSDASQEAGSQVADGVARPERRDKSATSGSANTQVAHVSATSSVAATSDPHGQAEVAEVADVAVFQDTPSLEDWLSLLDDDTVASWGRAY